MSEKKRRKSGNKVFKKLKVNLPLNFDFEYQF